MLAVAGAPGFLAAAVVFVDGRPSSTLGLFLLDAAIFIAFGNVISLAFLLVGVFRFITTGHHASSLVDDQNQRTLARLVPARRLQEQIPIPDVRKISKIQPKESRVSR